MKSTRLADDLFAAAFAQSRDPRSQAYKDGVRDGIVRRLNKCKLPTPYAQGTAECDAYYAGNQEGLRIADRHLKESA